MSRPPRPANQGGRRTPGGLGGDAVSSLADVLPALCRDLSLDQKVNELAFLALWDSQVTAIAGPMVAGQTRAVRLQQRGARRILLVRVGHAALAAELGFHVAALKEALNRFEPQTGVRIDHIQLTVGAVGRGPGG